MLCSCEKPHVNKDLSASLIVANLRRVDPTGTLSLRAKFAADAKRRFKELGRQIRDYILGALVGKQEQPDLFKLSANATWKYDFPSDPEKMTAFLAWLEEQQKQGVLEVQIGPARFGTSNQWSDKYIQSAYKKGARDAYTRAGFGALTGMTVDAYLSSAFFAPIHADALALLYMRSFSELQGITAAMDQKITRVLADGLVQGISPRKIARNLTKEVDISSVRAERIARTECLPGETLVDTAMVRAIFRRWYEGPMVKIVTRNGAEFSATPNHPMLTQNGWIGAGLLKKGDNLICNNREQGSGSSGNKNVNRSPATLSEIFDLLATVGVRERESTTNPDFHGDGMDGYVDILSTDRELLYGNFASISKPLAENVLTPTAFSTTSFCPLCGRLLDINKKSCFCITPNSDTCFLQSSFDCGAINSERLGDLIKSFSGKVSAFDCFKGQVPSVVVVDPSVIPREPLSFGVGPGNTLLPQNFSNTSLVKANSISDFPLSHSGEIRFDDVLSVNIHSFCGHVYNLQTPFGYYTICPLSHIYTGNTIRAYSEATLNSYESFGIEGVSVLAEYLTAGDDRVCEKCAALEGKVYTIEEARGLIPQHPLCRCCYIAVLG